MRQKRHWGMGMELFSRRWDRRDGIVAAAAVALIVVSNQPWYAIGAEGSVRIWNAWSHWQWSDAVVLGLLAAGVHLAYRGRSQARGAAWLAVVMLLGGLGLAGWQWQRAGDTEVRVVSLLSYSTQPGETSEDLRRRTEEAAVAAWADQSPLAFRSAPRWGFYAGAGSLIVMFAAIARGLMQSRPRRA